MSEASPARGVEEGIRTMLARCVGAGYVAVLLVFAPTIVEGAVSGSVWWTLFAATVTFVPGIGIGVAGFGRGPRIDRIRRWSAAAALGYALAVAGALLLDIPASTGRLWVTLFPGLAAIAAAGAWRALPTFGYMLVLMPGTLVVRHLVAGRSFVVPGDLQGFGEAAGAAGPIGQVLARSLIGIVLGVAFAGSILMAIRVGRLVDEAAAASQRAVADAAAEVARAIERDRLDAFVHDEVMGLLLAANRRGESAVAAGQATATLAVLDDFGDGEGDGELEVAAAVETVRQAVVTAGAPHLGPWWIPVSVRIEGEGTVPGEVVAALAGATTEAVRNVVRHAGPAATCEVEIVAAPGRMAVTVVDDGIGFDPGRVSEHRLGLSVSVRSRMIRAGGTAEIESAPGCGTRVALLWESM